MVHCHLSFSTQLITHSQGDTCYFLGYCAECRHELLPAGRSESGHWGRYDPESLGQHRWLSNRGNKEINSAVCDKAKMLCRDGARNWTWPSRQQRVYSLLTSLIRVIVIGLLVLFSRRGLLACRGSAVSSRLPGRHPLLWGSDTRRIKPPVSSHRTCREHSGISEAALKDISDGSVVALNIVWFSLTLLDSRAWGSSCCSRALDRDHLLHHHWASLTWLLRSSTTCGHPWKGRFWGHGWISGATWWLWTEQ